MNSLPFVPTLFDYAIIISGIIIIGGSAMFAVVYLLVKLAHYVGWKLFVGGTAIAAFAFLFAFSIFGR